MSIEVKNITKTFGQVQALKGVSMRINSGELVALLGPSGSGKTTLLRIMAGLELPDRGDSSVSFNDENVSDLKAADRRVGFVFQHYALFRHMTVFENIAFGLRVRPRATRPSNETIKKKVMELLSLVQLESLAHRLPSQLSGGQRQRVALARALAVEPKVLLLDEPFGALDAKVRKELRRWIRQLHNEIHITSVFVTHDQEEALEVADRVVIMNGGCIEQIGTPEEVYDHPKNSFVYNFLGNVNVFEGRIENGRIKIENLKIKDPSLNGSMDMAKAYVRPHDVELTPLPKGTHSHAAVIRHIRSIGSMVHVELQPKDSSSTIEVEVSREKYRELQLSVGSSVYFEISKSQIFVEDYTI